jgi:hypothetical protein
MLRFFKGWFVEPSGRHDDRNTAEETHKIIAAEINIVEAINAHVQWKQRLKAYINGTSTETLDPMVICRDDQCALGKWIHGPALRHFSGSESFQQLRSDHAQFHFIAANVVLKVQNNQHSEATELVGGEYMRLSHKVVNALSQLAE